ncbi:hypothetical protein JW711_01495 [Candidatus Woesearchaeota archaeon]|nr:hypothetical protein [Candidatus Woesearchaeota archaeon]
MKLVIDANIVMAMLIRPGKSLDLCYLRNLELYAPKLLFLELAKNSHLIIKKSILDENQFRIFFNKIAEKIMVIPEEEYLTYREYAKLICPDPKDLEYFALALYLKCGIWSNEKKLKQQDHIKVYATHDLMKKLKL